MEAQIKALLLVTVIISSATEEVTKDLTGTVGGRVTLPDPETEFGFILFKAKNLAMVNKGELTILEKNYEKKLLYSKDTGLFTIIDLLREESGIYTIDSKTGGFTRNYRLTVYESVAAPAVTTLNVSSDSCTLLCVVDKAGEVTLLWYKGEEILKQNSSALSLSLTVHKQDYNSSHRCVAANPADNKTVSVNVKRSCGQSYMRTQEKQEERNHVGIIIPIVFSVIILVSAFMIKRKFFHKDKTTTSTRGAENTETDVQYSDVHFYENRRSQQEGNFPEPSGVIELNNLKTVYDKLEVHRLVSDSTDPGDNV